MGWDTDKILGTGLIATLIIFIVGQFCALLCGCETLPMEIGGTIVTGLVGYMGRSLAEKIKQNPHEGNKDNKAPPDDKTQEV